CGVSGYTDKTSTKVAGCSSGGYGSSGCNKMNTFDWLSDMDIPLSMRFNVVEVRFKGGRKDYFRNINHIELYNGDKVVCEMTNGHHIGTVSLQGDLVRLQMKKKQIAVNDEIRSILRKATPKDLEKLTQAMARDMPAMYRTREIVRELKLNMKVSDVEFQSDNSKATFYYSSDERVDFRELIKILASEFRVRVEMRQINLRQEAGRLGGIGSCGRELCCSTWINDFKNISTSAARYQNLSLNPSKLSGQCGRLKCCLNYELETYMDALKDIPKVEQSLKTKKGEATLQKTDIFRKIMWFGFSQEANWYPVAIPDVIKIMEMNKKGILPESLEILEPPMPENKTEKRSESLNADLVGLDKKYSREQPKKKRKKRRSNDKRKTGNKELPGK
ncbi:MAG: regulatory iron-sulfur-containing complex subunit RicT, partial [Spirosomataceae bacterium]